MDESLEIKSKLRFRDGLRYNVSIACSKPLNYVFLIVGIASLGLFVYNMMTADTTMDVRFSQSFVLLIPPFLFFANVPVGVWKATAELLRNPILKDEVVYRLTKDKILLETSQGQAEVNWDSYTRIVESKHDFRLFMDRVQAQVIPKYSLDEEEIQAIRRIINEAVDPQIVKLRGI